MRIALDRSMPDLERPLGLTVLEESETLLIEKSESRRISGRAFGHPYFRGDSMMWMGAVPSRGSLRSFVHTRADPSPNCVRT